MRSNAITRCPMECRLTHSPRPWQCQVLLRRETDQSGAKVAAKEVPFGPLLKDKTKLEEMLRRAQLAILNPSVPPSFFEDFNTKSLKPGERPPGSAKQLAFSNDVVCLDLQGPEVTDLSFIDLPGIHFVSVVNVITQSNTVSRRQVSYRTSPRGRIAATSTRSRTWSKSI